MTSINSSGIVPIQLATAQAATSSQQRVASTERVATDAARAIFQTDQLELTAENVSEVGATSKGGDRDADGRQAWTVIVRRGPDDQAETNPDAKGAPLDPDDEAQSHFVADA